MEKNKIKVYLASPFFSEEQIERVARVESALEANPAIEEYFSPRKDQLEHLTFGSKEWAAAIYQNDIKHVQWADVIVAVLDYEGETELHGVKHGHVDSGTAFEIGYAIASNKPVILVHEKGGIVNLMLSQSCHAYLDRVEAVEDYDFNTMPEIAFEGEVL
ncbi:nucleoside 2-deoxyribosyltransferase [Virgibacillus halophilus]|uniref:Nucleoside 2-deoxyribosyltransferase n=1 Tax=Tigheibacillus halophilus TaxID=361280 RepID=A0ABU5C5D9_9BACI|nr:nucleoside 2-deoxyribosyltransferase [Virgibacillus halophilus]